jgi:urocanate hydratase
MKTLKPSLTIPEAIRLTGHLLEHHGTTGAYAKNREGETCSRYSDYASCWCYVGAQDVVRGLLDQSILADYNGSYTRRCDRAAGIEYADQWDGAAPDEQLRIARKLQNYQG